MSSASRAFNLQDIVPPTAYAAGYWYAVGCADWARVHGRLAAHHPRCACTIQLLAVLWSSFDRCLLSTPLLNRAVFNSERREIMNMTYIRPRRWFLRSLTLLLILSLFPFIAPRLDTAQGQRARQPIAARLIVTAQYDEEETVKGPDSKGNSKLSISLSCARGVQLSGITNPNGTVDILDLPGAPSSVSGAINYTTEFETGSNASIHATQAFAGTFVSDGAFAEAFWSDEGNGLDVRVKSHAQLKGHCSQESKDDSGHVTRTDNCDGNIAGANAVIGFGKTESNEDTDRTPDTRYKTQFEFSFDAVPAPTTDNPSQPQPNSVIDFADTTWHGAQTRGDAKAGYKVEFDGTKQSDTGGKKRLHVSAQIVPGAPSRSAVESPGKSQGDKESIADEFVSAALARRFQILI